MSSEPLAMLPTGELRLGLCCIFREQPIKFRNTTVKAISGMERSAGLAKLSQLCLTNATALLQALQYCAEAGIGCFRVNSQILPIKTHEQCGYQMHELPEGDAIEQAFRACGSFAQEHGIRTCFHPDQFVVLNSPRAEVVARSVAELEYQAEVAEWIGADVVNIHGGGGYGDKPAALDRFARGLEQLSPRVRTRLTIENDDTTFTPADLLPLCQRESIPLVYDVHHHRCLSDSLTLEEATHAAASTWNRQPLFHISSPLEGWEGSNPKRHHDYIDPADFPPCWRGRALTVEVEAKAKELAVLRLKKQLNERWVVYLLRCGDDSLYTGISNCLARRLEQHASGTASRYTRSRLPVKLVHEESHSSKSAALKRELAIKAMPRAAKERLIAGKPRES